VKAAAKQLPNARADALAEALDLDVNTAGICHACLCTVSFAIDDGNPHRIRGETVHMTPILWDEGLRGPALDALRQACDADVPDAEQGLAELDEYGARCTVARAIVRRLARDLTRRTRLEMRFETVARPQLERAPPEFN
jgi:hypothetical protein